MNVDIPRPGEGWKHYSGDQVYVIVAIARMEDSQELVVVYTAKGTDDVWVRPLSNFMNLMKDGSRFSRASTGNSMSEHYAAGGS